MNISDRIINPLQSQSKPFQQAENASLSYVIDYTAYLGADTIASSTWASARTLTITPSSTDYTTTAKVSGTPGNYTLVNKITTTAGSLDERIVCLEILRNDNTALVGDYQ